MKILVSTPYSLDSLSGNTVSANRIASILTEAGCEAVVISASEVDIEGEEGDALIALHARKSAEAVWKYRELYSNRKILLFLTGTDLYGDIPNGCETCEKSMQIADYLIVSQSASLASVPERFRAKARVVRKSIALPEGIAKSISEFEKQQTPASPPSIVIASHLREVKQPFLICEALALLPELDVKVELLGRVIDDGYGEMAKAWMAKDARFHWVEDCPHLSTLEKMATATVTLNTSLLEGGANSVGESVVLGTPVLASEIEGNIGLLGERYTGYFQSGSAQSVAAQNLADLLEKLVQDVNFHQTLKQQIIERQAEFSREAEQSDWLSLLG